MDASTLFMFAFVGMIALVSSLLSLTTRRTKKNAAGEPEPKDFLDILEPIFFSGLATVCWWALSVLWPAFATEASFVVFGFLWLALGFSFMALTVTFVLLVLWEAVKQRGKPNLYLRESRDSEY